jgi:TatD DNase family protein
VKIPFIDIHTHHRKVSDKIISVPSIFLQDIDSESQLPYPFTAGIHPWHVDLFDLEEVETMLESLENQKMMIAVGETGLDKKYNSDFEKQQMIFKVHIDYASKKQLPLIIHCVKAWDEILYYSKQTDVPFILHGFNSSPEMTKQLIHSGFYFSIGISLIKDIKWFKEILQLIPATSLFFETDEGGLDIRYIYYQASSIFQCTVEELKQQIFDNYMRLFHHQ